MAPVILVIAIYFPDYIYLIGIACCIAIVSDVLDGVIARRLGVATQKLRIWDSTIDSVFWLSACWCVWLCFPQFVLKHKWLIIVLVAMELLPDIIYLFRFSKMGCAHSYGAKLFSLFIFILFCCLFFASYAGIVFWIAAMLGIIANTDEFLISFILPSRVCDVPSSYHAWLIKKGVAFKNTGYSIKGFAQQCCAVQECDATEV